jgi:predicted DNA-binding protein (MmcQ/YjbR family)
LLLSELADYAKEKYQIKEEYKWAEFPGFSVLADPQTGKWAALLMRRWDYERGEELLRCDIKCGRQCIAEFHVPYVTNAFRMKGNKWVGVIFDDTTEPKVVFELFDRAVRALAQRGFNIVLDPADGDGGAGKKYSDTLLPLESMRGNYDRRRFAQREAEEKRKAIEQSKANEKAQAKAEAIEKMKAKRKEKGKGKGKNRFGL